MFQEGLLVAGRFRIIKKLSQGGIGTIWLAKYEKLDRIVVIKEIGKTDELIKRQIWAHEVNMLKDLAHPDLPTLFDVIDVDGELSLVMSYIEGKTLNQLLREQGAQPQQLVIDWGKQLCDILNYLHNRTPPIIYGDMKPSNVILRANGQLALIDFGSAIFWGTQSIAFTQKYSSPQQSALEQQIDTRSDIYSLGVTLFHLITGELPSEPLYEIKSVWKYYPTLKPEFGRIIEKCTQKSPDLRYQTAYELRKALNTCGRLKLSSACTYIIDFLCAQKELFCGQRKLRYDSSIIACHNTSDDDLIRYNAELLVRVQNDMKNTEV